MQVIVSEAALKEANKCSYSFRCIENGYCGTHECDVEYADGKNILFIKSKRQIFCHYRLTFGEYQICRCPVHYEMFKNKMHRDRLYASQQVQ